jgi:PGF-pre-PGF domain-containing protein
MEKEEDNDVIIKKRWIIMIKNEILVGIMVCLVALTGTVTAAQSATVIMTFDDGWESVLQNATPIMDANGQKGVEFIITGQPDLAWNGQPNNYMNVVQLTQLYGKGWDLGSHTVSHVDLTTVNGTTLNYELSTSQDWLFNNGFPRGSMYFAYPDGMYNITVINALKANHYVAARTTDLPNGSYPNYNLSSPDIFMMKAYETVGGTGDGTDNDTTVENQINNAVASNGTLEIIFHKIVGTFSPDDPNAPPNAATNASTEFLISDFQNVSNYLKKLSDNGSVTVTTLSGYFGVVALPRYIPPSPTNISGVTYMSLTTSHMNVSWSPGIGSNNTDLYNVYVNGTRINDTIYPFVNITVFPGELINVSVYAVNTTNGITVNPIPAYLNITVPLLPTYIPQTPTNVTTAFVTNNTIGLTWSEGTGGNLTDYYRIFVSGTWISNMTASTDITFNAIPGLNYQVEIFAVNATNIVTQNMTSVKYNASIPVYIPSTPTSVTTAFVTNNTIGLGWSEGTGGNMTDYYRVIVNGLWLPNVTNTNITFNATPGLNYQVEIFAVNSTYTDTINLTPAQYNASIPVYIPSTPTSVTTSFVTNNTIGLGWSEGTGGNMTDYYRVIVNGLWLPNVTNMNITFNAIPGLNYQVEIYAVNSTYTDTINLTPAQYNASIPLYTPPICVEINQSSGNFWAVFEWNNGTGGNGTDDNITDSYNVSVSGSSINGTVWINLTTNKSINVTSVPHGIINISVYAYNNSNGGVQNPIPLFMSIQIPNNLIDFSNVWAEYDVYAGDTLRIMPILYNLDNDTVSFTTNATNATINSTTGEFIYNTSKGEQGTYHWNITAYKTQGPPRIIDFTVVVTIKPVYNSGDGGGGGGGDVSTYDPNTIYYERRDSEIRHNDSNTVEFLNNGLVDNVTFYGIRNYGDVTVKVSILKGNPTPSYLSNAYKFFSVMLDTIKQNEEYLYISNSTVVVNVNKSNLSDNVIHVYRYVNNSWIPVGIEDLHVDNSSSNSSIEQFKLKSDGLSNFAIVLEPMPTEVGAIQLAVGNNNVSYDKVALTGNKIVDNAIKQVVPESLYRRIINMIKKYMPWV